MSASQDFVALEWIRGELENTLESAQVSLEAAAVSPDDVANMRSCLTAIHQVHGTLKMVALEGPTAVASEMEQVAQALMNNEVPDNQLALETLMQAILQLPAYLDRLHREQADSTRNYLPMVNNLRFARGEEKLPGVEGDMEGELGIDLSPLTTPPGDDVINAYFQGDGEGNLPKISQRYKRSLAAILKKKDVRENLTTIGKLFSMLDRLCGESPMGNLSDIGLAVVEGIATGGIKLDKTSASLLREMDGAIEALAEEGQSGLAKPIEESLALGLLDLVNGASKKSKRIEDIQARYASEAPEPEDVAIGPDDETMSAVARILIEELKSVTDKLDLYVRASSRNNNDLVSLLPILEQISSTMVVLGNAGQQTTVSEQIAVIREIEGGSDPDEETLLNMAQSLLQIEASLSALILDAEDGTEADNFANLDEAQAAVVRETRSALAASKDRVIEFISSDFDRAKVEGLPGELRALRGGLLIVQQARAGDVLEAAANYVERELLTGDVTPELEQMDDLADAITSVDYFLERLLENAEDPYLQMLEVAERAVAKLGYDVDAELPDAPVTAVAEEVIEELVEEGGDVELEEIELETVEVEEDFDFETVDESKLELPAEEVEAEEIAEIEEIAATSEPESAETEVTEQAEEVEEDLIDDEILEIFVDEAEEVLENITEFLPVWQGNPTDGEALTEVRRAFHTLKGSGRMVGATVVGELAWSVENLLNRVIEKTIKPTTDVVSLVADAVARIPEGVEAFKNGNQDDFDPSALTAAADALAEGGEIAEADVEVEEFEEESALEEDTVLELEEEESDDAGFVLEEVETTSAEDLLDSDDLDLEQIFAIEAEEKLAVIDGFLSSGGEVTGDLVAAFHTLKGSAAMAEIDSISLIATPMEQLTNDYLVQNRAVDDHLTSFVGESVGLIRAVLVDVDGNRAEVAGGADFLARLEGEIGGVATSPGGFDFEQILMLSQANVAVDGWDNRDAVVEELKLARVQATSLNQPALAALTTAMLRIYESLDSRPEDMTLSLMKRAHDHLVFMFDALASSQQIRPADQVVEELNEIDITASTSVPGAEAPAAGSEPALEETVDAASVAAPAAGMVALPEDEIDEDVLPIFLEETEELLEEMDASISGWEETGEPGEHLDLLLRQLHTLKGGARMAGLASLGEYTHNVETFLIGVQSNPVAFDDDFFGQVHSQLDEITRRAEIYRNFVNGAASEDDLASMKMAPVAGAAAVVATAAVVETTEEVPVPEPVAIPEAVPASAPAGDAVVELPADKVDEDILPIFLEESDDLVEELEASIQNWSESPGDTEIHDLLLRNLHTLKGGARMAGLNSLGEYAHNFETFLIGIQQNPVELDDDFFALLARRQDEVVRRVEIYKKLSVGGASDEELESLKTAIEPSLDSEPVAAVPATEPSPDTEAAKPAVATTKDDKAASANQEMVRVSADLLEELNGLAGESSITRGRVEQQIVDFGESLEEMEVTINRVREQVRRLEIEAESRETLIQTQQGSLVDEGFDELEMDRYTMLQEISRALNESTSDMLDLKDTLTNRSRDAETLLHQQARSSSELQEGLTRTRMVPFARLIPRLRRIVRQISAEVGKSVRFDAYNVEGELDRNVLERIVAPLEHMLRNAVDHGIEEKEKRVAAGKPEQGRISLRLSREGGYVVLTISDDGGGIAVDAVRKKAVERGLITEGQDVSDHEVMQFIMHAGFSTAQKLTQISGRGVGMDVVGSEIKALGGSMSIDSTYGVGTEFTIRIPFTVSINRALMIVVGEESYAIPLNTIEGIVRVSPYELEAYYQPEAPMFEYAGQPYRLAYMGRMLDNSEDPNLAGQVSPLPVILARSGDHSVALQVDRVIGSREVVVKTLGSQFDDVGGISGATVLGDGSVVIILDCMALVRSYEESLESAVVQSVDEDQMPEPISDVKTVMIVDDSVTVRKVTSRLMERNGYQVVTAKDGLDAMNQLQDMRPDVMLLDIEMPRMDGFEVLRSVRRDEELNDLPIIMITSRTGEKHKQQAAELGVNKFLGKPFVEASLLETIDEMLTLARSGS